ncbi:hypothetical protein ACWNXI_17585 [Caldibacillus thermoamylovorans]
MPMDLLREKAGPSSGGGQDTLSMELFPKNARLKQPFSSPSGGQKLSMDLLCEKAGPSSGGRQAALFMELFRLEPCIAFRGGVKAARIIFFNIPFFT